MESIQEMLDDVERRIEEHRSLALKLLHEKCSLQETLKTLVATSKAEQVNLSDVDREELQVTIDRLNTRLSTVDVTIVTSRDESQVEALEKVNGMITELIAKSGCLEALPLAESYLNSCSRGTGSKFEKHLLSCTSDDQKDVKKRIEYIVENLRVVEYADGSQNQNNLYPQLQPCDAKYGAKE